MSDKKEGSPLKKFFAMGSGPTLETFPELVDIVVWSRFVLAIIYGGMLARGNQSGAKVLLFALNFVAFMPMLYCSTVRLSCRSLSLLSWERKRTNLLELDL